MFHLPTATIPQFLYKLTFYSLTKKPVTINYAKPINGNRAKRRKCKRVSRTELMVLQPLIGYTSGAKTHFYTRHQIALGAMERVLLSHNYLLWHHPREKSFFYKVTHGCHIGICRAAVHEDIGFSTVTMQIAVNDDLKIDIISSLNRYLWHM